MGIFWASTRTWLIAASVLAVAVVLMVAVHFTIFSVAEKLARRRGSHVLSSFLKSIKRPARFFLVFTGLILALQVISLPDKVHAAAEHILELGMIAGIGWTFTKLARFSAAFVENRFKADVADNLAARRVRTQTRVLERVIKSLVVIVTIAVMLMTFPGVRQIGASVLASAGIAGLVIGMAARSTFSSLIAGLQVAITRPINLEDAVIVEGEWGWIEEIETTYVVVRLWDLRRLIVPLNYFIEHPFQNWTRTTSDLLGTVMLYTDYSVPVDELREELRRILKESKLWDGKAVALHVTDLTENTMQLRALMSATDSGKCFELRCFVREKLVRFLQEKHPDCLPTHRARLDIPVFEKAANGHQPEPPTGESSPPQHSFAANPPDNPRRVP